MFEQFLFWLGVAIQVSGDRQSHLVLCLHDIALRHFTPELTWVFSYKYVSPQRESSMMSQREDIHDQATRQDDIIDSILEDFNQFNQPIIVVYNHGHEDNVIKQESKDKYGTYILLYQTGDVLQDIRSQLNRLKCNSAWNARAKFVVAIMQAADSPPQNRAQVETENKEIFAEFWKHNIVEVTLLQSAHSFEGNVPVNRGSPAIEVYTWFPYSASGHCAKVTDVVLLDTWVTKNNTGHFLCNNNLFPTKIPKYLPGCPIRISTFESEPAVMYP
jgi:hypothetical protein